MPDIKRVGELIERLTRLSERSEVPWAETSDERAFQAALRGYTVTISHEYVGQEWGAEVYVYTIKVHDKLGKLLDAATEKDFPNDYFPRERTAGTVFQELYELARRKALRVDEAFDDLLGSL
jgi:hypothetical protein